jgi:hypothetical protein
MALERLFTRKFKVFIVASRAPLSPECTLPGKKSDHPSPSGKGRQREREREREFLRGPLNGQSACDRSWRQAVIRVIEDALPLRFEKIEGAATGGSHEVGMRGRGVPHSRANFLLFVRRFRGLTIVGSDRPTRYLCPYLTRCSSALLS